jgi:lipid-binding SYLF domain-containing protein
MNKKLRITACAAFLALLSVSVAQAEDDVQAQSQQAIANFKAKDTSLATFFANSAGYAVFPDVGKGGLIVGGAHGKGMVYEKGGNPIGKATMSQASIGAQVGGQTFAQVIFFQTPAALADFKSGKFEMSTDVSAVAVKEGASTQANYKNGVAVFTMPKSGLMAAASIGGQKFKFEPLTVAPTGRY